MAANVPINEQHSQIMELSATEGQVGRSQRLSFPLRCAGNDERSQLLRGLLAKEPGPEGTIRLLSALERFTSAEKATNKPGNRDFDGRRILDSLCRSDLGSRGRGGGTTAKSAVAEVAVVSATAGAKCKRAVSLKYLLIRVHPSATPRLCFIFSINLSTIELDLATELGSEAGKMLSFLTGAESGLTNPKEIAASVTTSG